MALDDQNHGYGLLSRDGACLAEVTIRLIDVQQTGIAVRNWLITDLR